MNFFEWSRSDPPADVLDLSAQGALSGILHDYGGANPRVLESILSQMFALGARMTVVEYRYLDADYRDEHSRFYSKAFRRYPSVAHRLHFFSDAVPERFLDPTRPLFFGGLNYLGFAVLRPVAGAPVGRTMIKPPTELEPYITCLAEDQVDLFGSPLAVRAAPFMAQDAQLSVCAHATLWVTAYHHHLAFRRPRLLPGEIAEAVPSELGLGRPTPSLGLSIFQIAETATRIGLPALVYALDALPPGETLFRVVCRYLNSGMPVTVAGGEHAFVLVGYRRVRTPDGEERLHFIRQDDETGPYQLVESPFLDDYSPWEYVIVPLPEKAYLSGEKAEVVGKRRLTYSIERSGHPEAQALLSDLGDAATPVSFRSTLMESNRFKETLGRRGVPEDVVSLYQRLQLSRWVWVVELTRRDERNRGEPCVTAEAIVDATDHLRDLHVLAWRIPGALFLWHPDENRIDVAGEIGPVPLLPSVALGSSELA